jgi:hypothetical protein
MLVTDNQTMRHTWSHVKIVEMGRIGIVQEHLTRIFLIPAQPATPSIRILPSTTVSIPGTEDLQMVWRVADLLPVHTLLT